MKDDNQTVEFDELEEGKRYFSCDPENQYVLEVIRKEDDRIIYEAFDDEFSHVGTLKPEKWNPYQYKPVDSIHYDGPSLNDL